MRNRWELTKGGFKKEGHIDYINEAGSLVAWLVPEREKWRICIVGQHPLHMKLASSENIAKTMVMLALGGRERNNEQK